ncbi:MAG: Mini-ribonuclease 3 [Ruminococcus sp.]
MDIINKNIDPKTLPSLTCAFVGDGVYELLVREYLVKHDGRRVGDLNRIKVDMVCAKAQSEAAHKLMPYLTEEEVAVYKRGRNVNVNSVPKNAALKDYHAATGFEALFGYLYLCERKERIRELFDIVISE